MKLLVDVGVGRKVETFLTECGFDSKSVRDIDPSMKDSEILKIALSEERVHCSVRTSVPTQKDRQFFVKFQYL
ncbi:MAG: DUF5615 family PIN-like protein [Ignavibacteria bacterium]|nr:DUF5615 family PIN-like protein [Ignavibacteria bacterium]